MIGVVLGVVLLLGMFSSAAVSSFGRLHRQTSIGVYAQRLLDRVGFGFAHDSPLRRQRYEALLSVTILDEVRGGEWVF